MTNMIWITLLQIFGATLIAGVFTHLGVWISQRGAAAVVKQTFEGQRVLARDAALRDYRKQQIAPYIEAARQRFRIWSAMHAEVGGGDRAKLLELQAQVTDPDFHSLIVTFVERYPTTHSGLLSTNLLPLRAMPSQHTPQQKSWTKLSKCGLR